MQSQRLPFWSRWRQEPGEAREHMAGAGGPDRSESNGSTHDTHAGANNKAKANIPVVCANLAGFDEIYGAARIRDPKLGYSVLKIADMLQSEHICGLPAEIKRGSVLMALDAAGVQLEEVLQDASQRQRALCGYEAVQQKRMEEFQAHKTQEIAGLQAELERITGEYQARIKDSRDEVSREQERLRSWQARKAMEAQRLSDAVALCVAQGKAMTIESVTTVLERAAMADERRRPHRALWRARVAGRVQGSSAGW